MISLLQTGDNSLKGEETIRVAFTWQTFFFLLHEAKHLTQQIMIAWLLTNRKSTQVQT